MEEVKSAPELEVLELRGDVGGENRLSGARLSVNPVDGKVLDAALISSNLMATLGTVSPVQKVIA
jgi:hypothetical protein